MLRGGEEGIDSKGISVQDIISSFLILILLFVSYSLISFNFYLFYFPGAAAEPLGSARGALRAPRGLRVAQVGNLCFDLSL